MASQGSGGVAGPNYGAVQAELRGIAFQFASIAAGVRELRAVVSNFAALEQQLRLTNAVARGTEEQFRKMEAVARNFALASQFAAAETANSFFFLASAGFSVEESLAAANGVLLLAQGNLANIGETSDIVASNIRAFGLEARDAGRIANVFAAANANSQATLQKLGFAFRQVGPIAANTGLSIEQTTAALGVLFDVGLRGEQAGTALRNVLVRLQAPTGETAELLKELEITVTDASGNFLGLNEVLVQLADQGLSDADLALISGTEALAGFNALLDAAGTTADGANGRLLSLEEAVTGTNQAYVQAQAQLETLRGALTVATNSFDELRLLLGSSLAPILVDLANGFSDFVLVLRELDAQQFATIAQFGIMAAGVLVLGRAFFGLGGFINGVRDAQRSYQRQARRTAATNTLLSNSNNRVGASLVRVSAATSLFASRMAVIGAAALGPLGLIATLGGMALAFTQVGNAADQADFDERFGDFEDRAEQFRRRSRQLSLQNFVDPETGVGAAAALEAQSGLIRDARAALEEGRRERAFFAEEIRVTSAEADQLRTVLRRSLINFRDTLNEATDIYTPEQARQLEQELVEHISTIASDYEGGLDALDALRDSLLARAASADELAPGALLRDPYFRLAGQVTSIIEEFSSASPEIQNLANRALEQSQNIDQLFQFLTDPDAGIFAGVIADPKLIEERIQQLDESNNKLIAEIELAEGKQSQFLDDLGKSVFAYLESNFARQEEVVSAARAAIRSEDFANELSDTIDLDGDTFAQALELLVTYIEGAGVSTDVLRDIETARLRVPIIADELRGFGVELRKLQLEAARSIAELSNNPLTVLNSEIDNLRFELGNEATKFGEEVAKLYTDEIAGATTAVAQIDSDIEEAFKQGVIIVDGKSVRAQESAEEFADAVFDRYVGILELAGSYDPASRSQQRNLEGLRNLLDRYSAIMFARAKATEEAINVERKNTLERIQQERFNARIGESSFSSQLAALELSALSSDTGFAEAIGNQELLAIRRAENELPDTLSRLRNEYENFFRSKVVYGLQLAFDEELVDAFSGRGVEGLDFDDLINNTDNYVGAAISALSRAIGNDLSVEDTNERLLRGETFLRELAALAKSEQEAVRAAIEALNVEMLRNIEQFDRDVKSVTASADASLANLRRRIAEQTGGGDLTQLLIDEEKTALISDMVDGINDITEEYDELIRLAGNDEALTSMLIDQKRELIDATRQATQAEMDYYDSLEGRVAKMMEGHQAALDNFIRLNTYSGTFTEGIYAQLNQLAIDLPTSFEMGMNITKQAVEGTSTVLSDLILGIDDDWKSATANMLRNMASFIMESIIRALLLKAIMATIPGLQGLASAPVQIPHMGSLGSLPGPNLANANGNMFDKGAVVPTPISFNRKGGTGTAAEIGTEAILPLGRGSDGKLGVYGGGGGTTIIEGSTFIFQPKMEGMGGGSAKDEAAMAKRLGKAMEEMFQTRETDLMSRISSQSGMTMSKVRS